MATFSKEERTKHIDETSPCLLDPTLSAGGRRDFLKEKLLELLGLEDDVEDWKEAGIHLCHLCNHGSNKGWCGNPLHVYIGTPAENSGDRSSDQCFVGVINETSVQRLRPEKKPTKARAKKRQKSEKPESRLVGPASPVAFEPIVRRSERTSHVDLTAPCQPGEPPTAKQLSRTLDQEVGNGMDVVSLCGNPHCSNPLHHAFAVAGEERDLQTQAKEERLRLLLAHEQFANASISALAREARVSRTLVRRVIASVGLDRSKVVGQDGRLYKSHY